MGYVWPKCWCGRPSRGKVKSSEVVMAHNCRQCSPEHCHWQRFLEGLEYPPTGGDDGHPIQAH